MSEDQRTVDWYFDFISPYSYFALTRIERISASARIVCRPVLFAGLLGRWEHKGPAEIPSKRVWTYRSCQWWAQRQGIPFRFPVAHPFNSLPYLRLSIAAGNELSAVSAIFRQLWTTGADAADPAVLAELVHSLGVDPARLGDQDVKDALRRSTDEAIARGVFGVPSLMIDDQLFWGSDAMDFAAEYLVDPSILETAEMHRISELPVGVSRTAS